MIANFDRWQEPLAKQGITTSTELANYLLETYQIATLPGTAFGIPAGELSLRLATSYLDMETDEQADTLMQTFRSGIDAETLTRDHLPMMNGAIGRFAELIEQMG